MQLTPDLIFGAALLVAAILGGVALLIFTLIRLFAPDLAKSTPPDVVHRIIDFQEKVLVLLLNRATETATTQDDQFYIAGLQLLGYTVSGNPDTGYTITPPVAKESAKLL